jgi:hypothetical protein
VSILTQSDSSVMQTTICLSICTWFHQFCYTSWSRQRHLISFARCVNTTINCIIAIFYGQIDLVTNEHKTFIQAYRHELVLKQGIDALIGNSSFAEGSSLLEARFSNLIDYCGAIVTLFRGTSTVESDFFVLRWENDEFRKVLSDLGLEGVLQTK